MLAVPKYVFYIAESQIPKTASGKIQKFKLRERATGLLNEARVSPVAGTA
jgi:acyl-coenzyme A synthetase/AMP-(fatty) acid ligase